jgi:hypothetical protein
VRYVFLLAPVEVEILFVFVLRQAQDDKNKKIATKTGEWIAKIHYPFAPNYSGTPFVNLTAKVINKDFRKN